MPCHIGTPRRGRIGRGRKAFDNQATALEGYGTEVSIPIRLLIDNWEARFIAHYLDAGRHEVHINSYWLVKNMMGILLEDMAANWAATQISTQSLRTYLDNMGTMLRGLNATFDWKDFTPNRIINHGLKVGGRGLGDSFTVAHPCTPAETSTLPKGKGPLETSPRAQPMEGISSSQHAPDHSFPIPSTISSSHMMRTTSQRDYTLLSFKKTMPLPVQMPGGEGEDEYYFGYPILEETPSDAVALDSSK